VRLREGVFEYWDLSDYILGETPASKWMWFSYPIEQLSPRYVPESPLWARVFRGFKSRMPIGMDIPMWFFVLVSGALAIAPWLPWRFSLRTLLITMTLVAVVMGAIVYSMR
jgi:hypothetical protein